MRVPRFDTTGWQERQRAADHIVWTNDVGDSLVVNVSAGQSMGPVSDQEAWRTLGRRVAEDLGGGMVSGESFEAELAPLFQLIYKREDGRGYLYGGMVFIPRQGHVWVIGSRCREHGMTGTREALVAAQLAEQGRLEIERVPASDATGAGGQVRNWFRDPYDPEYPGRVVRSLSDDEQYDVLVPHHPLSRLRRILSTVRRTVRFDA